MEDRKSWKIKDEAVLADLVALMELTDDDKSTLVAEKANAETIAPEMVDAFYDRLLAHEETAEYFEGSMDHLREAVANWFTELFSGEYDNAYVAGRLKIGQVHVRIGLPVRYPIAMMDVMYEYGEKVIAQSDDPDKVRAAFRKILALDVAIFNQAYEDTQLKHLSDLVGNEALARRLLTES